MIYEGSSDIFGYYYIPLQATASDSYIIEVRSPGYVSQNATVPGTAGSYLVNFDLQRDPQSRESWFDTLISTVKQKAWDALDSFLRNNDVIGSSIDWSDDFEVGVKGFELKITIDLTITYSAPYEVTIEILAGPFNNRVGTSVRVSLPPPLSMLDAVFRFGMTLRLIDPDQDLQTFNPILVVDNVDIGAAIGFQFTWSLEEFLESKKMQNEKESARFLEKLITKLKKFAKDAYDPKKQWDFETNLEVYVNVELGIRVEFNGADGSPQPGLTLENVSFYPYFNLGASLEASATIAYRGYINKWLKFNIVSGTLSISAGTELNLFPYQVTYDIPENSITLSFGRAVLRAPHVSATFSWSFLTFSGTETLVSWSANDFDSGWLYSFIFARSSYANRNYAPNNPTISGPTSINRGQSGTFSFTTTDPDGDDVQYQIDWGDGTPITTSGWFSSGTTYQASHSWSSPGTFTIQARATDGDLYSTWATYQVTVNPTAPNQPILSGSSSVVVGTTYYLSVSGTDSNGANVYFTVYWGDGSSSVSSWVSSGSSVTFSHAYGSTGTKTIVVVIENSYGLTNDASKSVSVTNNAPYRPGTPSGPSSGYVGTSYTYSAQTSDPNGHKIRYQFDWGDGHTSTTAYYASGTRVYVSHTWSYGASYGITYYVKVRAQDYYGAWSSWSYSKAVVIYTSGGGSGPGGPTINSKESINVNGQLEIAFTLVSSSTMKNNDLLVLLSTVFMIQLLIVSASVMIGVLFHYFQRKCSEMANEECLLSNPRF